MIRSGIQACLWVAMILLAGVWTSGAQGLAQPDEDQIRELMVLRGGVPHFFKKVLETQDPLKVAYFGGSITAGAGASRPEYCYRARVTSYLREQLPGRDIVEVNASMGGTGSFLGAFRVQQDCMKQSPDLVFVEYAVNDGGETEKQCIASMEGIVRQIWTANPQCDIVFIYTTVEGWFKSYQSGEIPQSIRAHEKVAQHYGIASINVGKAAALMVNSGKWKREDFARDGVHPTDACYQVYSDVILKCGELARSQWSSEAKVAARTPLVPSLSVSPLEPGRMIPAASAQLGKGWKTGAKSPAGYFPSVIESDQPGAVLTFVFSGPYLGFFDVLGPDSGAFEYSIDGGEWVLVKNFDRWAKDYYRTHCMRVAEGLSYSKAHTLKLRVSEVQSEGSKGRFTRLGYFLVASPEPQLPAEDVRAKAQALFPTDGVPQGWRLSAWHDVSAAPPEGAQWEVKEGILHGSTPRGTWLVSEKEYNDFYIEFEFLIPERGNSGFGIRFPSPGDPAFDGMEIQMCDPRYYTGSGYGYELGELTGCVYMAILPRVDMYLPGQWNKYQICCRGPHLSIVLNGTQIVLANLDEETKTLERGKPLCERPRQGYLGFQELSRGGGHVMIRHAKIYEFGK